MHASVFMGATLQRAAALPLAKSQPACRRHTSARLRAAPPPSAFFSRGGPQPGDGNTSNAATSSSAHETMVPDGAIKSLSPEARRIFREAQDNIIELNKSRLRALEELKAARHKIAELESKLEDAVAEASSATAQLQQISPSQQQVAQPPPAPINYGRDQGQQRDSQQARQQAPPAQQQPPAEGGPSITVVYETGWGNAFLHHNPDNRGWTTIPGTKMENGTQQFPDKKVITVSGRSLEFVINDGGSDWDKPWKGGANYVVKEPGTYRLKNGKVIKLA